MIHGVVLKPLTAHADERGWLMELLRADEPVFRRFGQVYVTAVYPGVVKGWHMHHRQWDHFAVVRGTVKMVLYDRREDSPTRGEVLELFPGRQQPLLVAIPPLVVHGFKGVGTEEALVVNIPSEPYAASDPDEIRFDPHGKDVPYDWSRRDG